MKLKINTILIILGILILSCLLYLYLKSRINNIDSENQAVYYNNIKINVKDSNQLSSLLHRYANLKENRISNQLITDDYIRNCKKNGLFIKLSFSDEVMISVSGYDDMQIGRLIYYLQNDNQSLIAVYVNDIPTVLALNEQEQTEIQNCLELFN